MKIQIKSWINASILFECEADSLKIAVELAVKQRADLQGADLQGADLRGADLQGAYLRGADLQGADLRGAYLQGADLQEAYLRGANLQRANLQGAYLQGAYLQGANLQGAYLRGAYLRGEKLDKAPLMIQGMKWDILITKQQIFIGCQQHKAEEWFKFKDKEISDMHEEALVWWKANRELIKSLWESHCKDTTS